MYLQQEDGHGPQDTDDLSCQPQVVLMCHIALLGWNTVGGQRSFNYRSTQAKDDYRVLMNPVFDSDPH